ncbi:tetratricopeptide repeat protein [Patescibacteria group bacterium]|nr:tetratricopeptide repeat protein [Patescibacteria group bacterium]
MYLNIALILIAAVCFIIIIALFIRKIPRLRTLDVDTVPEAQAAKVRDRILLDRMLRKTTAGKEIVKNKTIPIFAILKNAILKVFKKIYEMEKSFEKHSSGGSGLSDAELNNKIKHLLDEAKQLIKNENIADAEKILIEIISLDHKNVDAYKMLAQVYLNEKEYKQAIQTFQFILKVEMKNSKTIVKKDESGKEKKSITNALELAILYTDIGTIYQKMGKNDQSLINYKKALDLEPNNPKHLDQIIEISIMLKNKEMAAEMLSRLAGVNPENQKLKEWQDKINDLK